MPDPAGGVSHARRSAKTTLQLERSPAAVVRRAPLAAVRQAVRLLDRRFSDWDGCMSFLTHAAFSVMMLLALWAGIWSHQKCDSQ